MSPRLFDSDDVARDPDAAPLTFVENVDCPACGAAFEALFTADAATLDALVDPPVAGHTCPGCAHTFSTAMTGWTVYTEAG